MFTLFRRCAYNVPSLSEFQLSCFHGCLQAAMEEALLRILTPKRSIDILRDVHQAREAGKPYTIVFVGVNGVGKSTNLAKVTRDR